VFILDDPYVHLDIYDSVSLEIYYETKSATEQGRTDRIYKFNDTQLHPCSKTFIMFKSNWFDLVIMGDLVWSNFHAANSRIFSSKHNHIHSTKSCQRSNYFASQACVVIKNHFSATGNTIESLTN
jgi:hypothetical protein